MKTDKLKEVYEKYKHFDDELSGLDSYTVSNMEYYNMSDRDKQRMLADLWQAVKEAAEKGEKI